MTKWLAGLALAAAVAAAGCGGGGSELSKSDFISKADAICADAHQKQQAVTIPQLNPATATKAEMQQFGDAIAKDAKIERDQIGQLRKLKPPKDFQAQFDKALTDLSSGLDDVDKAVAAAAKGDAATISSTLTSAQARVTPANAVAKNYGLKVCGSNG